MRRTTSWTALIACLALATGAAAKGRPAPGSCPADVPGALAVACPCGGGDTSWESHGAYVRCMTQWLRVQQKAGCLTRGKQHEIVRCTVRSTCGRPGAVVCAKAGGPRRRIAPDAASCAAGGGLPLGTGSVCSAWATLETTTSSTSTTTTTSSTSTSVPPTTTTTLPATTLYGNPIEFAGASTHWPGYLLGAPVTVTRAGTLTHLGVIAKAVGAQVRLALYVDDAGAPGRLVAATPPAGMALGANEVSVAEMALAPGTYWLMAAYDVEASVGIEEPVDSAVVVYAEYDFASPLPDPFPPAASYTGQRFNYFARVTD